MVKQELVGIDKDVGRDTIWGIGIGALIIFAGFLIPGIGAIGIPSLPQSLSGPTARFIVIVVLASIFETFFFFDIALSFFKDKLKKFGLKLPFFMVAVITSVLFSFFHLSAYGNFATSSGAFFTAFIVGMVFSYQRQIFKSNIPGIFTHAVLNWWIGFGSKLVIVGAVTLLAMA